MFAAGPAGATGPPGRPGIGVTGPQDSTGTAGPSFVGGGPSPGPKLPTPVHDKNMARDFLTGLDNSAGTAATNMSTSIETLAEYLRRYGIPSSPLHETLQKAAMQAGWIPPWNAE